MGALAILKRVDKTNRRASFPDFKATEFSFLRDVLGRNPD